MHELHAQQQAYSIRQLSTSSENFLNKNINSTILNAGNLVTENISVESNQLTHFSNKEFANLPITENTKRALEENLKFKLD